MTVINAFAFPPIILASQSPRRAELLRQIGVPFEVIVPLDAHEAEKLETERAGELPLHYVERVCRAKAEMMRAQIMQTLPEQAEFQPILCADTTVALGDEILGKPVDAAAAHTMLQKLSGQTHQVHTAVALATRHDMMVRIVSSDVRFHTLSEDEIHAYIDSGEPFGKAGAYAIQGLGACFVAHLNGSFSAVKGLPVFEVAQMLKQYSA